MFFYLIRRLIYSIPIALAVGFVCFMLVQIAPGDPINVIVPPDAPQDVVEQVRRDYGLDKPLPVQLGIWLMKVVQGDLGASLATGRPVWSDLQSAIGNTLMLAASASLLGFILGCMLMAIIFAPLVAPHDPFQGIHLKICRIAQAVRPGLADDKNLGVSC